MSSQALRVLLVEDDEDDYFLACDVLKSIGSARYDIVWCETFDKAFDAIKTQHFDVALIDYQIGGRTGIDFVKTVNTGGIDVPMILLTGLRDQGIDIAASEAGASDYLNKDELTPSVVERSIRYACANAANRRSLAEWGSLLQTTLDNTGSGLAAVDASGQLVAYNQRLSELIGQISPQIGPVAIPLTSGDEDASRLGACVAEILRRTSAGGLGGNELRTLDGRILDLAVNRTDEGGSVVVIRDITEQKLFEQSLTDAKEEAEAASRSKTIFLATMSHELRTPLNAIIGFSELMLRGVGGELQPTTYKSYMEDILGSGRHLLEFINEILEFSKAEGGQSDINKEDLHLKSELDFCLRLITPSAKKSGVNLQSDFEGFNGCIFADQTAFRRMVINLLSNAVKFTSEGGVVDLLAKQGEDGSVSISVADTGIGIPENQLPFVLQPFHQVHDGADRPYEGSGLGLAIVNSLAKLHDAKLTVDSVVGSGTTVTLKFPQAAVTAGPGDSWSRTVAM